MLGYGLETGTAAELRLSLTITLTLGDTGFAVLTPLLGYRRWSRFLNHSRMLYLVFSFDISGFCGKLSSLSV